MYGSHLINFARSRKCSESSEVAIILSFRSTFFLKALK